MISKRQQLLFLVKKHPNWSNKQYAEHLGQSQASIRGALSDMGIKRQRKSHGNDPYKGPLIEGPKPQLTKQAIVSKANSNRSGYLKLM